MKLKPQWFYYSFLTAPLWGLLFYVKVWNLPSLEKWLPSLIFSLTQAVFSTFGALLFGLLISLALLSCEGKKYQTLRGITLAFAALPSLVGISALFWWSSVFNFLPRGLGAIVTVHTFMNFGLIALGLDAIFRTRLGRCNEVSSTLGVSPWLFWSKVAFPLVVRDIALLFLVVFGFCFTSLAVPMIFSTANQTTLEVLIFQWGVRQGDWGAALSLSVVQWFVIALLALSLGWFQMPQKGVGSSWGWLTRSEFQLFYLIPIIFVLSAYVRLLLEFLKPSFWKEFAEIFSLSAFLGTLLTGLLVALSFLFLLLGAAWIEPQSKFKKFMRSYAAPSTAIIGVFLFLIPGHSIAADLIKLSIGLCLLFFPGLYRWMGESHFESLRTQWVQAQVLGASPWIIAKRIIWPQSLEVMAWVTGLAALWSVSDFALSSMLLQRPFSLALVANEAFNSYRIDMGLAYTLFCLLLGIGFTLLLRKCLYVRN